MLTSAWSAFWVVSDFFQIIECWTDRMDGWMDGWRCLSPNFHFRRRHSSVPCQTVDRRSGPFLNPFWNVLYLQCRSGPKSVCYVGSWNVSCWKGIWKVLIGQELIFHFHSSLVACFKVLFRKLSQTKCRHVEMRGIFFHLPPELGQCLWVVFFFVLELTGNVYLEWKLVGKIVLWRFYLFFAEAKNETFASNRKRGFRRELFECRDGTIFFFFFFFFWKVLDQAWKYSWSLSFPFFLVSVKVVKERIINNRS